MAASRIMIFMFSVMLNEESSNDSLIDFLNASIFLFIQMFRGVEFTKS